MPTGSDALCPAATTRDVIHRFCQERCQLNGGLQNRYVTGSDAVG
jgi:phospholipase C